MKTDKKSGQPSRTFFESRATPSHVSNNKTASNSKGPEPLFFQSIVDSITLPVVVIGTDMRIKFANHAAELISSGNLKKSPVGERCYRFILGYEESCINQGKICPLVDAQENGKTTRTECCLGMQDGSSKYYEIISSALVSENGTHYGIIEIYNDITDWKLFEKWLETSQENSEHLVKERTDSLLEMNKALRREVHERQMAEVGLMSAKKRSELIYRLVPSAIFTVDLDRQITSWNDKAETITGYSAEEIIGQPCSVFSLYPCTEFCGVFSDTVDKPIVGRECEIKTKKGSTKIISKNADFLRDDYGHVIGAVESFEDVTELKRVEKELLTERDKLKGMLSAMGQGMHILNRDFVIEYQNDVIREAFGDTVGEKCYKIYKDLDHPCEICAMHTAIETKTIMRTELLMANGKYYEQSYTPFQDVDGQTKTLILLRDITDEKIMQAESMRTAQLASVGELAAGVAHEINNPINGIINYAQIIKDDIWENQAMTEISEKIIREGERVAHIVSNLLSFARQYDDKFAGVDLDDVVHDAIDLVQHQLLKNGIIVEIDLPDDLPSVFSHHQQLQQVFINLLSNARFALNQRYADKNPDKKITITGEVVRLDGKEYVRIHCKDLGTGISPEMVDKIFEPFFSSKNTGEGTGLGLSICHGIIKNSNGFLHVQTELGRYTNMIVDLPVYHVEFEQNV